MCSEIYTNDFGTNFQVTVYDQSSGIVDLSTATSILFNFLKPDSTILSANGSLVNDGTDGLVRYITSSGDIDLAGNWRLQVTANFSGGKWHTNVYNFKVYDAIG